MMQVYEPSLWHQSSRQSASKASEAIEEFSGKTYLLIVMQDNPDPDSIAAAVALRRLANSLADLQCSIACGGTIGRG